MASNEVTEEILDLLNQSPDAFDALQRVLHSFSSATISKPDPGELFLTNEDKYLNLMMGAMEYAIFPHAARPAFPTFVGIATRDSAWRWVAHHVRSNVADEDWVRAPNLGKVAHASSKMLLTMGRYEFPIYLTKGQGGRLVRYVEHYQINPRDAEFLDILGIALRFLISLPTNVPHYGRAQSVPRSRPLFACFEFWRNLG